MSNSKELQSLTNTMTDIVTSYAPEHREMIQVIKDNLPEITRATSLFGKHQSQFMDNLLTVSHTTPLRNLRQILAEVEKSRMALKEAYFKDEKRNIEIQMKLRDIELTDDPLKKQLLEIEANELRSQAETSAIYVSGAIRSITNYMEQYNSILESLGNPNFNEIDFEAEEERYHIQKAFEQGITAARSHNGVIDEGNQIYFMQIGINGAMAQAEVSGYLQLENNIIQNALNDIKAGKEGLFPNHQLTLNFLNDMSSKYAGCSTQYAKAKGMTGKISQVASLKEGDTRLLLK